MRKITLSSEIPQGLVCLKFEADWCGPCKKLTPTVEKLSEEFTDVAFFGINIDNARELAKEYEVRSIPTLVFLKDGKEVRRVVGFNLIDPLRKVIRDLKDL